MTSYIIGIEFKKGECEGDKNEMASRWCRNVFNDWHLIWLRTRSSPQNRMIKVVQIGIGMMNLGYGSVMIVVQVIVGIISMAEHTIKINPLLKIHRRLNRINRLPNLKGELEAVQREDLGAKICRST